jgi:hypothetical protein
MHGTEEIYVLYGAIYTDGVFDTGHIYRIFGTVETYRLLSQGTHTEYLTRWKITDPLVTGDNCIIFCTWETYRQYGKGNTYRLFDTGDICIHFGNWGYLHIFGTEDNYVLLGTMILINTLAQGKIQTILKHEIFTDCLAEGIFTECFVQGTLIIFFGKAIFTDCLAQGILTYSLTQQNTTYYRLYGNMGYLHRVGSWYNKTIFYSWNIAY